MRKIFIAISLMASTVLATGCTKVQTSTVPESTITWSQSQGGSSDNVSVRTADLESMSGEIRNIYYAGENTVLVAADSVYSYDVASGQILNETGKTNFFEENYFKTDNGFIVLGIGDSNGLSCIIYNSQLEKVKEITSSELTGENEMIFSPALVAVSKDGKKLAYATDKGLYYYDIASGSKSVLVDLVDENEVKRAGLAMFDEVSFINNDSAIVFKSQSFDIPIVDGAPALDTYGTIKVDGTGLVVKKSADFSVKKIIAYNDNTILTEDFLTASGKVMVMNNDTGKSEIITLTTQKESGAVFGSEKGTYFATSSDGQGGITVRVYDTNSGKVVMEEILKEDSSYISREPEILILDESKTCFVILGNRQDDIPTIVRVFNFG